MEKTMRSPKYLLTCAVTIAAAIFVTVAADTQTGAPSNPPKLYAADGTELPSWHAVSGRVMLKPGEHVTVTLNGPAAFQDDSYQCIATKGVGGSLIMVIELTPRDASHFEISSQTNKFPEAPIPVAYICVGSG